MENANERPGGVEPLIGGGGGGKPPTETPKPETPAGGAKEVLPNPGASTISVEVTTAEGAPKTETGGAKIETPAGPPKPPPSAGVSMLTPPPDERVQINVLVSKELKAKTEAEANLAYEYGWIPSPTTTQYFIWLIDKYMFEVMKRAAAQRRAEATAAKE